MIVEGRDYWEAPSPGAPANRIAIGLHMELEEHELHATDEDIQRVVVDEFKEKCANHDLIADLDNIKIKRLSSSCILALAKVVATGG